MSVLRQRGWLAAGALAAVVLGTTSTAALAGLAAEQESAGSVSPPVSECQVPALPGTVVDVDLSDMGSMMGGPMMGPGPGWQHMGPGWQQMGPPGMMSLSSAPDVVRQGKVSFLAYNSGATPHEVMVMPLAPGQAIGQRPIGSNGEIDETGSLGEASQTCGPGPGEAMGIAPGSMGWTTLTLKPGRYELICNLPGHYGAGMYAELDVTA